MQPMLTTSVHARQYESKWYDGVSATPAISDIAVNSCIAIRDYQWCC
jgi:hypothetical protein